MRRPSVLKREAGRTHEGTEQFRSRWHTQPHSPSPSATRERVTTVRRAGRAIYFGVILLPGFRDEAAVEGLGENRSWRP